MNLRAAEAQESFQVVDAFPGLELQNPTEIVADPTSEDGLIVLEQRGRVLQVDGSGKRRLVLDLQELCLSSSDVFGGNEEGLLGWAFHPNFLENGWAFFYCSRANPRRTELRSVVLDAKSLNAQGESKMLKSFPQPYSNHNGGALRFGPDGLLYIGTGDGGSGGDPENRAQNLESPLGKIHRIKIMSPTQYTAAENGLKGNKKALKEIYSWGFRNPWKMAFRPESNELWVGDVGQNKVEEITVVSKAGENHGWRYYEGHTNYSKEKAAKETKFVFPVFEYEHNNKTGGYSVTGGVFSEDKALASIKGHYLFADYISGRIWALNPEESQAGKKIPSNAVREIAHQNGISCFGHSSSGYLFMCGHRSGKIYKMQKINAKAAHD